jgi:hypothetical protein
LGRLPRVPILLDDPDNEIVAAAKFVEGTPLDLVEVLSLPILRRVIGVFGVLMEE